MRRLNHFKNMSPVPKRRLSQPLNSTRRKLVIVSAGENQETTIFCFQYLATLMKAKQRYAKAKP